MLEAFAGLVTGDYAPLMRPNNQNHGYRYGDDQDFEWQHLRQWPPDEYEPGAMICMLCLWLMAVRNALEAAIAVAFKKDRRKRQVVKISRSQLAPPLCQRCSETILWTAGCELVAKFPFEKELLT